MVCRAFGKDQNYTFARTPLPNCDIAKPCLANSVRNELLQVPIAKGIKCMTIQAKAVLWNIVIACFDLVNRAYIPRHVIIFS